MKTAMEIASGFPRGQHQSRAKHLVACAKSEAMLQAADEIEKLLQSDGIRMILEGDHTTPFHAVIESWVRTTRETAQEEEKE